MKDVISLLVTGFAILTPSASKSSQLLHVPKTRSELLGESSQSSKARALEVRIIGGVDAPENRFPYTVSMQDTDEAHFCGASLIAPDMILTAGHCNGYVAQAVINPYRLSQPIDASETFGIVEAFIHPDFSFGSNMVYDFLIYKLSGISTVKPIRLNQHGGIPIEGEQLDVMGWGDTSYIQSSLPDVLQHANVKYITNEICENDSSSGSDEMGTYEGLISDDMMCASDVNKDSCQGDSGGPIVIAGEDSDGDVQVGITSWGYGCAQAHYAGVYSRMSSGWDWIRYIICNNSDQPPEDLECDGVTVTYSPAPSSSPTSPTLSPAPTGGPSDVLLVIQTSYILAAFEIEDSFGDVVFQLPAGSYSTGSTAEVLTLRNGAEYTLKIRDEFGLNGFAAVYLGRDPDPGSVLAFHDSRDVSALSELDIPFRVDADSVIAVFSTAAPVLPTSVPSSEPSVPTSSPAPSAPLTTIVLVLKLDGSPSETGFRLESTDGEVIQKSLPGSFVNPYATFRKEFTVEAAKDYQLILLDDWGDGLTTSARVYLNSVAVNNEIAKYEPFSNEFLHEFIVPFTTSLSSDYASSDTEVNVRVYTDDKPGETGWKVEDLQGRVQYKTVVGAYSKPYQYYNTTLILPIHQEFLFVVTDSSGDGFSGSIVVYLGNETSTDKILYTFPGTGSFSEHRGGFSTSLSLSTMEPTEESGEDSSASTTDKSGADESQYILTGTAIALFFAETFVFML